MQISEVRRKGTEISHINSEENLLKNYLSFKGYLYKGFASLKFIQLFLTQFWAKYR